MCSCFIGMRLCKDAASWWMMQRCEYMENTKVTEKKESFPVPEK